MVLAARLLAAGHPGAPPVLREVDLELPPGRFLCLLGPNGAGKSTLLRTLAGLLPPRGGQVLLDDRPVTAWSAQQRARRLGFLPQEVQPVFAFTVEEAVGLGARVAGHGHWFESRLSPTTRAAVHRALEAVDAAGLAGRRLGNLSGGERRRVLVASVLAQEPAFLLLDEPAAMLDLHHQAALFAMLRRLARQGLGVLCVTHDFNLAATFADELLVLGRGRLLARGSAGEVLVPELLEGLFGGHVLLLPRADAPPAVLPR